MPALSWLACCTSGQHCFRGRSCETLPLIQSPMCEDAMAIHGFNVDRRRRAEAGWSSLSWSDSPALSQMRLNGGHYLAQDEHAPATQKGPLPQRTSAKQRTRNARQTRDGRRVQEVREVHEVRAIGKSRSAHQDHLSEHAKQRGAPRRERANVLKPRRAAEADQCLPVRGKYTLEVVEVRTLFQLAQCPHAFWRVRPTRYRREPLYKFELDALVVSPQPVKVLPSAMSARTRVVFAQSAGVDDQFVLAAAQRANSSMRGNAYFGRSDGRSQQLILPMDLLGRIRRLPDACILKTMQPINESDLKALPMRGACAEVRVEHFLAEMRFSLKALLS
uniref:Uncharacterized protein n=1 Tax=Chrysotila carterae TaxID=13221 RepID=A0A7S4B289_CHRCT